MNRQILRLGLVVILVLTGAAGLGVSQDVQFVRGEPDLDVYVPDPTLAVDSTSELTLQIANDGEVSAGAVSERGTVTNARSVTVELVDDDVPFTVETKKQSIGSVADGGVEPVRVTVSVPKSVEPGEYSMDVKLQYSHTYQHYPNSGVTQERSRRVTESIDVQIEERPRFELTTVESDVQVGSSGKVVTEVTNVGAEVARDLTVELESSSADVTMGGTAKNTARIERLEPDANTTLTFETNVRPDAPIRNITLKGSVTYTDSEGKQASQEELSIGLRPRPDQNVSVSLDHSTLRLGETGAIRGTIRNDGPDNMENVVLVLAQTQFQARSQTYSVGDLPANESATFRFRGTVPSEADSVPHRIHVMTQYRTTTDTMRVKNESLHVPVADRRNAVTVTAVNPEFTTGEEGVLELEITNEREIEMRDVRLVLTVEDPLTSEFRATVLPALQPDETGSVAFDLEVDSGAHVSQFPATVDVTYIDQDAERTTARPSTIAIMVTESDGGGVPTEITIFVVLSALVIAGGWWFYWR